MVMYVILINFINIYSETHWYFYIIKKTFLFYTFYSNKRRQTFIIFKWLYIFPLVYTLWSTQIALYSPFDTINIKITS